MFVLLLMVKKGIAIFLSVLTLVMNVHFTVGEHFCSGDKVSAAIVWLDADISCKSENKDARCAAKNEKACCPFKAQFAEEEIDPTPSCSSHHAPSSTPTFNTSGCCETVFTGVSADVQSVLSTLVQDITFTFQAVTADVLKSVCFSFTPKFEYHTFWPPPLNRSFSVLFQVFRL